MEAILRIINILFVTSLWFWITKVHSPFLIADAIYLTSFSSVISVLFVGPLNQLTYRYFWSTKNFNSQTILSCITIITLTLTIISLSTTLKLHSFKVLPVSFSMIWTLTSLLHLYLNTQNLVQKKYKSYFLGSLYFTTNTYLLLHYVSSDNFLFAAFNSLLGLGYLILSLINALDWRENFQFRKFHYYKRYGIYLLPFTIVAITALPLSGLDKLLLTDKLATEDLVVYFFVYQFFIAPGLELGTSIAAWQQGKIRRVVSRADSKISSKKFAYTLFIVIIILLLLASLYLYYIPKFHPLADQIYKFDRHIVIYALMTSSVMFLNMVMASVLIGNGLMRKRIIHKMTISWIYVLTLYLFDLTLDRILLLLFAISILDILWTTIEILKFKRRLNYIV